MKKLLSGFLLILYLGTSSGLTLHTHYCMGRLAGWSLGYELPDICGKCGMNKSEGKDKGCCRDEHHVLKTSVDQKTLGSSFSLNLALAATVLPALHPEPVYLHFQDRALPAPLNAVPPPLNTVAVYIRNCVFRI